MITATKAVDDINGIVHIDNRNASSHYKRFTKGNVKYSVRLSDHHTVMATWVLSNENLPESKNISLVFLDDMTKPTRGDTNVSYTEHNSEKWPVAFPGNITNFEIIAFVYDCKKINEDDVLLIGNNFKQFVDGYISNFSDPLYDDRDKKAKKYLLKSNQFPKDLTETVNDKNQAFEKYIYDIVMSMYFPDKFENPDTTYTVGHVQESYMTVGSYQNNKGSFMKPADVINLYD